MAETERTLALVGLAHLCILLACVPHDTPPFGRIARNRRKTGIIAEGEQDNVHLWKKIQALDEDSAHQVSHRIVEFAREHGASILVFEHLGNFKPEKGKYSKRGDEKRSYWLRGKIFKYARYKA